MQSSLAPRNDSRSWRRNRIAAGIRWRDVHRRGTSVGADGDIRLDLDPHPEFDAWRWVALAELPGLAVPFKRPIYEVLVESFARFASV